MMMRLPYQKMVDNWTVCLILPSWSNCIHVAQNTWKARRAEQDCSSLLNHSTITSLVQPVSMKWECCSYVTWRNWCGICQCCGRKRNEHTPCYWGDLFSVNAMCKHFNQCSMPIYFSTFRIFFVRQAIFHETIMHESLFLAYKNSCLKSKCV